MVTTAGTDLRLWGSLGRIYLGMMGDVSCQTHFFRGGGVAKLHSVGALWGGGGGGEGGGGVGRGGSLPCPKSGPALA